MATKVLFVLSCTSLLFAACALPGNYAHAPANGQVSMAAAHRASVSAAAQPQAGQYPRTNHSVAMSVAADNAYAASGAYGHASSDAYHEPAPYHDAPYHHESAMAYGQAPAHVGMGHPPFHQGGYNVYNTHEFHAFLRTLKEADFDRNRLEIVRRASRNMAFYSQQVAEIIACFTFDTDRSTAAVILYPQTVDARNWHLIRKKFTFGSSFSSVERDISDLRPLAY